jgi:hypothetical protein
VDDANAGVVLDFLAVSIPVDPPLALCRGTWFDGAISELRTLIDALRNKIESSNDQNTEASHGCFHKSKGR